ncbi:MAG: LuxR C-terminal-related transcriptional regulator [Caldilineaceae bacterium]
MGEFESARSDLATALALARADGEPLTEWQLLLDLGQLWASRDYAQTGDYFQQALALARRLAQPISLAHALNRLGNWYLNVEERAAALRCHEEALAIFQAQNDAPGLAQTYDLLGLMVYLGGNPVQGAAYLQQAVALCQTLNDRQSLASSLTTLTLCGPGYSTDSVVPAPMALADFRHWHGQALQITEEIGWLAGQAYTLIAAGNFLGTIGHYGDALAQVQRGLALAQAIEHRQWICFAERTLGLLYRDLLDLPAARRHLEASITLAKAIGARFHVHQGAVYLSLLMIAQGELPQAATLLQETFSAALPLEPLAQRRVWGARAELALAQGDAEGALHIVERLLDAAVNLATEERGAIPYLAKVQGEGLVALHQWTAAEATLQAGLATAQAQGTPRFIWPLQVALGRLYQTQGRAGDATAAFSAARAVIATMAAHVPDPALHDNFLHQANALLPPLRAPSARQAAKAAHGGLTRREREVAALIAQGQSNRAIAATLILGERTVEGYIANIMAKLGLSARTQIAAWVVERGWNDKVNQ